METKRSVVTIGGGSGMPIINRALVKAGIEKIHSIVTTFDSGGDTGRMRTDERGQILAFSDYWRSLMSLWPDSRQKKFWEDMLKFRDGRTRNFGNLFFQFMSEKAGGLNRVDELFEKLTGASLVGEVIPVSLRPAEIYFETESGTVFRGEHRLDEMRMSLDRVKNIWLKPEVRANNEAVKAIAGADVILVCPGSMYGSVVTNFLPKGIKEAINKSRAKIILMTNIMSVANENKGFSQKEYVEVFEKYLKKNIFDLVIMTDIRKLDQKILNKVLGKYRLEHSEPIRHEPKWCRVETMVEDVAIIEENYDRLRHSEDKLTDLFRKIL